eukprot:CAMPEP_0170078942 /NCGR_PEP_ID=MMETSP0019_2-20121128/15448_1 /TAXON_ID=98059 /ORGANISM="Dinobryon sp., Strain UTEXLB2267" /LENGTH=173 /DNA_ID=CAMNT_0010292153 /DNA_START=366 /DNA_END=887 /DNA_ORIENTATION=-
MNPLASIKYHYWGKAECGKENVFSTALEMFRKGGIRPFFVGASATITRDLVFGGFFAIFRHKLLRMGNESNHSNNVSNNFMVNLVSGCLATILSSPFNYVRNVHYATPPDIHPPSAYQILLKLWKVSKTKGTFISQFQYLQGNLRIGWGTARVGCGMAFGAKVYAFCSEYTTK